MGEAVVRLPASAAFQKSRARRKHREYDAVLGDSAGGRRKRQLKPVPPAAYRPATASVTSHSTTAKAASGADDSPDTRERTMNISFAASEAAGRDVSSGSGEICRAALGGGRRLQTQRRRKNNRDRRPAGRAARKASAPAMRRRSVKRTRRRRQAGAQRRVGQPASGDFVRKAAVGKSRRARPSRPQSAGAARTRTRRSGGRPSLRIYVLALAVRALTSSQSRPASAADADKSASLRSSSAASAPTGSVYAVSSSASIQAIQRIVFFHSFSSPVPPDGVRPHRHQSSNTGKEYHVYKHKAILFYILLFFLGMHKAVRRCARPANGFVLYSSYRRIRRIRRLKNRHSCGAHGTAAAHGPQYGRLRGETARPTARFRSESDVNAILIFYGQPVAVQMRIVGKLKDAWYGFAGRFRKIQ